MHPDAQGKHESAVHSEREAHGRARARVRWSAPRTSTMVVAGCARTASPWTRQLTGNPAAIESQNGEHSDVVRTGLCFWRIKAACEGTCAARDQEARHAVRTARNGGEIVAMAGPRAAREQRPTKILSFESEKELDFFEPHAWHAQVPSNFLISNTRREGERKHGGDSPPVARGTLSMSCLLLARAAHVASTALILPKDSPLCEDHV